jgi:hypothetical protein
MHNVFEMRILCKHPFYYCTAIEGKQDAYYNPNGANRIQGEGWDALMQGGTNTLQGFAAVGKFRSGLCVMKIMGCPLVSGFKAESPRSQAVLGIKPGQKQRNEDLQTGICSLPRP